jgi:hypothetical protein
MSEVQGYLRNRLLLGPYSRAMPRALCWSYGGGWFLMSEVPLYPCTCIFSPGGHNGHALSLSLSLSLRQAPSLSLALALARALSLPPP